MSSKHRLPSGRPRHVSRIAAVLSSALTVAVLPLISVATAPAEAATGATWNLLAECESSGVWDINTGNGYYGGLQFSAGTWAAFGGRDYARRADLATRVQQIRTAEKVLDEQGWGAWPSCSEQLGLTQADADEPFRPGTHEIHVVERGDTLSTIAREHDVEGGWRAIYDLNRKRIGPNPNRLEVGMRLRLP